ncbi:MAG: ABC transporter permease subunit [Alphaproteobacteria bacterium]|nr:MAG: ABC transporter permease subunit [Alphaproteobacteria bacterium]
MTVAVSTAGFLVGTVLGSLAAWAKLTGGRVVRGTADAYTTVLRGIPDLLVIYLFYFGGSTLITAINRDWFGGQGFVSVPAFVVGMLAVGVCNGAYQAEVLRGAYLALHKGEIEAARAMGMGRWLAFRRVIAPQVLRFAVPGLGNCWQLCLKESALISVTGLTELLRQSFVASRSTREPFLFLTAGACLYLVITAVTTVAFSYLERRAMRGIRRA